MKRNWPKISCAVLSIRNREIVKIRCSIECAKSKKFGRKLNFIVLVTELYQRWSLKVVATMWRSWDSQLYTVLFSEYKRIANALKLIIGTIERSYQAQRNTKGVLIMTAETFKPFLSLPNSTKTHTDSKEPATTVNNVRFYSYCVFIVVLCVSISGIEVCLFVNISACL